jgi:hypothetical protein
LSLPTVRVPTDIYQTLREIRLSLESQHYSDAPTIQDMVSVALRRLILDWDDSDKQPQLLDELLEHRRAARSRMGRRGVKEL